MSVERTDAPSDLSRLAAPLAERYRIERELGAGGMATVYLAEDLKHHRKVAIKVLHAELSAILGPERFLKEIELTANLQHPHILPLFDSGSANGLLYYVMPYVDGETLRTRLEREKQLSIADAIRIASEAADALSYAHGRGVVHRDIKPENILLQNGHALVADFGIALAVQQAGGQRMTQTGLSLGTPQYMSPEQAMGERDIGPRSDIYSLGAVTYEMLSGDPPFTGSTAQAIVAQVITGEPRSIGAQRKTVPRHAEDAVMTALEKLPADRFASAADFANALSESARRDDRLPPRAAPLPARRSRALVGGLVALALLAGLAGGFALRRASGSDSANGVVVSTLLAPANEQWPVSRLGSQGFAISPDGRRIAVVTNSRDSAGALVIRSLDRVATTPLPGTSGATGPFWSPDGHSIGFFADHELKTIDVASGSVRSLCPAADGNGGAWNAHGVILFVPEDAGALHRVSATGGDCTALSLHGAPRGTGGTVFFLPDDDHFVLSADGATWLGRLGDDSLRLLRANSVAASVFAAPDYLLFRTDDRDLYAQRIDVRSGALEGEPDRIVDHVINPYGRLAVSASPAGVLVTETDRDAGPAVLALARVGGGAVDSLPLPAWTFRLAHDGHTVAVGGWKLWTMDVDRGVPTTVTTGVDSTVQTLVNPVWAPGDTMIAFEDGYRHFAINVFDPRSNTTRLLFNSPSATRPVRPNDWSPDGRQLAFSLGSGAGGSHTEPWTYDVASHTSRRLFVEPGDVTQMRYSRDGRWLAYQSNVSGADEIYLRALPDLGTPVRVSTAGGHLPRWRADGHELYYAAPNGSVLAVTIGAPGNAPSPPRVVNVAAGPGRRTFSDMDPTPDGERFLFSLEPGSDPGLTLIQNWWKLLPDGTK